MKKLLYTLVFASLFLSGCASHPKLDPVAEPSWYTNQTYFQEKNGMYFEMPVDTASTVMIGDGYIDRGDWAAFYGDKNIKNRGITYNSTEHVLYMIDSIAKYQPKKIFVQAGYYDAVNSSPVDSIVENIKQIFHRASVISPSTELYYINIVCNSKDAVRKTQEEVNEAVSKLEGFTYIDINNVLLQGVEDGTYSWNGGQLLNGAGYEAFAKALEPYIGRKALNKAVPEETSDSKFTVYYRHRISMFRSLPNTEGEIIMLGNSLNNNAMWTELFPFSKIVNRGISGDVIDGVKARLDEIEDEKPHKIFLMTGSNDIVNDPDITVSELYSRYSALIKEIRSRMPYTFLYVQSMLPLNPKSEFYNGFNAKAAELNKLLEAGSSMAEYIYVDIASHLMDENGDLNADYTTDGIHLSAAGYFVWATELTKAKRLQILDFGVNNKQ